MFRKFELSVFCFVVVLATFISVASAVSQDTKKGIICEGEYVLCTSAPCVPDPKDPDNKAICECKVNMGKNFGLSKCEEREPSKNVDGVTGLISTGLISTYSFAQALTKPVMVCPSGKPWTNCLDRPCTVNPLEPLNAVCYCDIERTSKFVTYGADCNSMT